MVQIVACFCVVLGMRQFLVGTTSTQDCPLVKCVGRSVGTCNVWCPNKHKVAILLLQCSMKVYVWNLHSVTDWLSNQTVVSDRDRPLLIPFAKPHCPRYTCRRTRYDCQQSRVLFRSRWFTNASVKSSQNFNTTLVAGFCRHQCHFSFQQSELA